MNTMNNKACGNVFPVRILNSYKELYAKVYTVCKMLAQAHYRLGKTTLQALL